MKNSKFKPAVKKQVKLATVVEGDPKAPFSIAAASRCRGGRYSFLWIAPLYPWSVAYNAECLEMRHQILFFESLIWLDLGLNPGLPVHRRTFYPLDKWANEPAVFRLRIGRVLHPARDYVCVCGGVNTDILSIFPSIDVGQYKQIGGIISGANPLQVGNIGSSPLLAKMRLTVENNFSWQNVCSIQ